VCTSLFNIFQITSYSINFKCDLTIIPTQKGERKDVNGGHREVGRADPNSESGSPARRKGEGGRKGLVRQWKSGVGWWVCVVWIDSLPWKAEGLSNGEGTGYVVHRTETSRE
jgi:hypothetical protein